jgi:hypothetical protein
MKKKQTKKPTNLKIGWVEYLEEKLKSPFAAVADEWQARGPLRAGGSISTRKK